MDLRVDVWVARDGAVHSVLLKDLSSVGARISTPVRFARRDVLSLIIETDRGEKARPVCSVASVRPLPGELHCDYGLKFTAPRPPEIEIIEKFVARQLLVRNAGADAFKIARVR